MPEPTRSFPKVEVPSMYTDRDEILSYRAEHYWTAFFEGSGKTDSTAVLGVKKEEVEQNLSNFIAGLDYIPLDKAQYCMQKMFMELEAAQRRDTSNHVYLAMTDMVAHYLYDPNSPVRDEDYFQPFVAAMAISDLTPDDLRPAFKYQAMASALNKRGTVAADFKFREKDGKEYNLHGLKADYTLLFFSNPGCHACQEIITQLLSIQGLDDAIAAGRLAIVNVYIDDDLESWRHYVDNYPESWHSGYNPGQTIRNELLYDVRAIPSLYLLDSGKRVLLKDAPSDKVLQILTTNL